jgi:hypothetical protein
MSKSLCVRFFHMLVYLSRTDVCVVSVCVCDILCTYYRLCRVYWKRHFQLVVYSQIEFKSLIEFWHFVGESFYLSRSTSAPLSFSLAHTIAVSQYACYFLLLQISQCTNIVFVPNCTVCVPVHVWLMINCHADNVLLFNSNYAWNYCIEQPYHFYWLTVLERSWRRCCVAVDGCAVDKQIKFC